MQIIDRLLSRQEIDTQKRVIIPTTEMPIVTHRHELCVWRKRAYHWLPSHEVPDGAQIVTIWERPLLLPKIDPQRLLWGMGLYDEYDELTDRTTTYLYKFPKDPAHLATTEASLARMVPGYTLDKKDAFVVLAGDAISYDDPERMLIRLTHAGHSGILSFMLGLILAYGVYDTEDHTLHTVQVSLPLLGSVVDRSYLVERVVESLADMGMFVTLSKQDQRHGQVVQLMIRDRELLHMLVKYMGEDRGWDQASKYLTQQTMKEELLATIQSETGNRQVREQAEYGVVKWLRK